MPRKHIHQKQFLTSMIAAFRVDGSAVTTSDGVNTGLIVGQHIAKIKKGSGADSNLVTITLNAPLGRVPTVLFQPITLDCECRQDSEPTKKVITVRTLKSTNLATGVDDADFNVFIFGTEDIYEGSY